MKKFKDKLFTRDQLQRILIKKCKIPLSYTNILLGNDAFLYYTNENRCRQYPLSYNANRIQSYKDKYARLKKKNEI
jgi:hypothetical protein